MVMYTLEQRCIRLKYYDITMKIKVMLQNVCETCVWKVHMAESKHDAIQNPISSGVEAN